MLFGKERQKVARAIRDLVVRPDRDLGTGSGDLGGGLQMLARLAAAPLRFAPQAATRIPLVLRELGERRRAIPARRRAAPDPMLALQALRGCFSADDVLRTRYLNLLASSMDRSTAAQVHPGFLTVLGQLTADETRIFSRFENDGPYPVITVQSRPKHGGTRRTELRHFSRLGEEAGCEHPTRAPLYLDNLCRLGLTELRPTKLSEDTRMFKSLEDHPDVVSLIARIGNMPAANDGHDHSDPMVADVQYKYLFVTSFGRQFYDACEYRPEAEM
jgi:Abortive infection alpha